MSQTLSHEAILQGSADALWEECKHADKIIRALMPDYFAECEWVQARGEPGSIRVITLGPAFPHVNQVTERLDKVDDATKTLSYTVDLEDEHPKASSFSAQVQFVPVDGSGDAASTEVIWTAKYEPVGDMNTARPQHLKTITSQVLLALERAVNSKKIMTHTEILDAAPNAIWNACKNADEILCTAMPQFFAASSFLKGHGEAGSIRVVKMGPAIPFVGEATERMDLFDDATKTLGYTVLKGDPRYKYFTSTVQFSAGPREGTTTGRWEASYVPEGDMGPPHHIQAIVKLVWQSFVDAAHADPNRYNA